MGSTSSSAARPSDLLRLNSEVFQAREGVVSVTPDMVALLQECARNNPRRKCRFLLHPASDDLLHEMLIVHCRGQYIRPHISHTSSKTYHVIAGEMMCVLFEDDGRVSSNYRLGGPEGLVMLRIPPGRFHTLIPVTETVAFTETIRGPFRGTAYADWAADETDDRQAAREYHEALCRQVLP